MQTGTYIEMARIEQGRSREWLGQIADVATSTILRWEKGQLSPTFDQMALIADALNKPISYFKGEDTGVNEIKTEVNPFAESVKFLGKLSELTEKNRTIVLNNIEQMLKGQGIAAQKKTKTS